MTKAIILTPEGALSPIDLSGLTDDLLYPNKDHPAVERISFEDSDGKRLIAIEGTQFTRVFISKAEKRAVVTVRPPALSDGGWGQDDGYPLDVVINDQGTVSLTANLELLNWSFNDGKMQGAINKFAEVVSGGAKGRRLIDSLDFNPKQLPFVLGFDNHQTGMGHTSLGLFTDSEGHSYIALAIAEDLKPGSYTRLADLAVRGGDEKKVKQLNYRDGPEWVTLGLFIYPLTSSSSWVYAWNMDSKDGLGYFLDVYNDSVNKAREGLWKSRNDIPWVVNPNVTKHRDSALLLFGGVGPAEHLRAVIPSVKNRKKKEKAPLRRVKLSYKWKQSRTNAAPLTMLSGTMKLLEISYPKVSSRKNVVIPEMDGEGEDSSAWRKRLFDEVRKLTSLESAGEANAEIEIEIGSIPARVPDARESFGAFDIWIGGATKKFYRSKPPKVTLRIRSGADGLTSLYFPSSTTSGLPVSIQPGSGKDPQLSSTAENVTGATEERLHRDSDANVRVFGGVDVVTDATLDIESDTRYGSRESVALTLRTLDAGVETPRLSFFQAKPFLYAAVGKIERDREGGTILARWQSADDGQWRMPYHAATLELPAQAIGEEMERGNRFWKDDSSSYIEDGKPVRYRFSPPTQVVIAPGSGRRRFNPVPNNVFRLVNRGGVESFQTELIYPVSTRYERGRDASIDVLISESSEFLGASVPNLPLARQSDKPPAEVFESELEAWAARPGRWQALDHSYRSLRLNNSAAKANFAARIAQLHLWNGNSPNESLTIREGLQFEIRSHNRKDEPGVTTPVVDEDGGAPTPPLMNPLPRNPVVVDVPPGASKRDRIVDFLSGRADWDADGSMGGIRGGVIHSIEFPSELVAVLRNPTSRSGWLGEVSFSNLGVTGSIEVAFDEGRTTFTAEVENGQISRLLRTRIGRLGITWSRAKHIIVYERTVLPSQQFDSQQRAAPHLAWPILRKTEEYIEPIDIVRDFAAESDADRSKTGFLNEFEFISKRIYVDSAWGEELDGDISGYKLPLWDGGLTQTEAQSGKDDHDGGVDSSNWFYPKPKLAFVSRGEDGAAVRQWIDDPDEMFFYTNTVEGAGGDPDAWPAVSGVDAPRGVFRLGVLTQRPNGPEWNDFIKGRAKSSPRRDGLRRRNFELRVSSDAAIDLQATRSDKPMFASIGLISVSRSAEQGMPVKLLSEKDDKKKHEVLKAVETLQRGAEFSGSVADITAPLREWHKNLHLRIRQFACNESAIKALKTDVTKLKEDAIAHLERGLTELPELPNPPSAAALIGDLRKDITGIALVAPNTITPFADELRDYLRESVARAIEDAGELENIQADVRKRVESVKSKVENTKATVHAQIVKVAEDRKMELGEASDELANLSKSLSDLETAAADSSSDIEAAIKATRKAIGVTKTKLSKLRKPPFLRLSKQITTFLSAVDGTLNLAESLPAKYEGHVREGLKMAKGAIAAANKGVDELGEAIINLTKALTNTVKAAFLPVDNAIARVEDHLTEFEKQTVESKAKAIEILLLLAREFDATIADVKASAIAATHTANKAVRTAVDNALSQIAAPLSAIYTASIELYSKSAKEFAGGVKKTESWFRDQLDTLETDSHTIIDELAKAGDNFCAELEKVEEQLRNKAKTLEENLVRDAGQFMTELVDEQTRRQFEEVERRAEEAVDKLRREYGESIGKVDTGLKLAKAIGDMPSLPDLSFNVDKAEYVFEDLKNQIATSPFGARVKEIDAGLRDLGINIPSSELLDQVIPTPEEIRAGFSSVINSLGGMEFAGLFEKFRLPQLRSDQYEISHGVDEKTRTAWAKARVNTNFKERQALFDAGAFGLFTSDMKLRALSEMRIDLNGARTSTSDGRMTANWSLQMGGVDMATFRDVMIRYDGRELSFDIDPTKIEYHPSLRFIADVAQKLEGSMPAGVKLVKDERGMPIGAEARLQTTIENPPPLGPVLLGPLTLDSGVALLLQNKGQFVIRSFAGVGTQERPIFCQIGWLGGGAWVTCNVVNRANPDDKNKRVTQFSGSVGLALGSMRAVNIANVAKGSYSFLLFANGEFSNAGSILRVGLSVRGSARLLAIATIYVYLLLQAVHSSSGGTKGTGVLRASVRISRFYKLRVRKAVRRDF